MQTTPVSSKYIKITNIISNSDLVLGNLCDFISGWFFVEEDTVYLFVVDTYL